MAMGPERGQEATLQVEMACVDELVPEDDLYRRIDALVDWGFVRPAAAAYYAEGVGRPSLDPVVLLKLMVAGALEGSGSMRELLRVASLRLDLRRFLGFGLQEKLPAHQTVSDAHAVRFLDGALFERLFARTVALCAEHDLLEGTHLSVDGFHLEANAALTSLRASLAGLAEPEAAASAAQEGEPAARSTSSAPAPAAPAEQPPSPPASEERAPLRVAEPAEGPAPRRPPSNRRSLSTSDPDAKLRHKPGQRRHLVYRGQVAVDPKARCVVACLAERADGFEGDGLSPILERARFHLPALASVAADAGYAAERVWQELESGGIAAFVPPQPHMIPDLARAPRTNSERLAQAAHRRCRTDEGRRARGRRLADGEGVIGEAKLRHGLARARCRGLPSVHIQLLLGCSAINLKRLALRLPHAASGQAANSATQSALAGARAASAGALPPSPATRATLADPVSPSVWTITLGLN